MVSFLRRPLVLGLVVVLLAVGAGSAVMASPGQSDGSRGHGGPNFDADDVIEPLHEWALGYDERDLDLVRQAFTDDATFVYASPAFEEPLVFTGIDEVMELFESSLAGQDDVRRHVTTNSVVERVDRRTAQVTSYLTLFSIPDPDGSPILLSTGVYRDTVKRGGDGEWRIQVRELTLDTAA